MDVEFINTITGYDPEKQPWGKGKIYEYGNEVTYISNPEGVEEGYSYSDTKNNISGYQQSNLFRYYDEQEKKWKNLKKGESITIKSTYYKYDPLELSNNGNDETIGLSKESKEYELLFDNMEEHYWLVTPATYTSDTPLYGIGTASHFGVSIGDNLCEGKWIYEPNAGIRPIVTMKANVNLKGGEGIDGSTQEKAWKIQ